jgi:F0F1-type ATP synthase membrane subunit b/b'
MDNSMFRKESGVATTNTSKEHWGFKFSIVPNGLSEDEVVTFVDNLIKSTKPPDDKQASLIKLAEQTVIEADKLAAGIKEDARNDANQEAEKILAEAVVKAQEQAEKAAQKTEKDAVVKANEALARAEKSAEETRQRVEKETQGLVAKAQKEATDLINGAHDRVDAIRNDAKIEAEFIVRRTSNHLADEIKAAVAGVSQNVLARLETLGEDNSVANEEDKTE